MVHSALQTAFFDRVSGSAQNIAGATDAWLWGERESLILWVPVTFGAGIAAWFMLPGAIAWTGFALSMLAFALAA